MKIGLIPVNVGVRSIDQMVATAQRAEQAGFESVWTFEHVVVPADYSSLYPYDDSGKMNSDPDSIYVDPLIALTAIAQHTTTLKLGTGVNILPQTNPLLLAKQAASLDFVSRARFMLGVGIGWLEEEYIAMGAPFTRRGARFDDYLAAMKKVWSGEMVEHQSEFLNWTGFKSYPLPQQKDQFPVVIGGAKGKVFERIARFGQGWYAPTKSVDELLALLPKLKQACDAVGRDPDSVEISCMWIPPLHGVDVVARYREAGVSRLVIPVPALGDNILAGIDSIGELIAGWR